MVVCKVRTWHQTTIESPYMFFSCLYSSKTERKVACSASDEDDADYQGYEDDYVEIARSWKYRYNTRMTCILRSENNHEICINQIRKAYDAFLMDFPFSVRCWKKYVSHEKKHSTNSKVMDVFERAVTAVPNSVDIWCMYCQFGTSTFEEEDSIRRLFERALNCVGNKFKSSVLWDLYFMYELSQQKWYNVAALYRRVLQIPTQDLDWYFQCFKDFILVHKLEEIVAPDEVAILNTVNNKDVALRVKSQQHLYIGIWKKAYQKSKSLEPSVVEPPRLFHTHGPPRNCSIVRLALPAFLQLKLHVAEVKFKIDNIGRTTVSNPIGTRLLRAIFRAATAYYSDCFCWDGMLRSEDITVIFDGSPESNIHVVFLKHATVPVSKKGLLADTNSWREILSEPFTLNKKRVPYFDSMFITLRSVPEDVVVNAVARQNWIEDVLSNPLLTFLSARLKLCRQVNTLYRNASNDERKLFDFEFQKLLMPNIVTRVDQNRLLTEVYWYPKERAFYARQQQQMPFFRNSRVMIQEFSARNAPFLIAFIRNFEAHAVESFVKLGIDIGNFEEIELMVDYYFWPLLPFLTGCLRQLAPKDRKISKILKSFRSGN